MKINAKELVNRFYEEVCREKYPEFNRKQIFGVCYAPFKYFRKAVSSGILPTIRFKLLGEFEPSVFRAVNFLRDFDKIYAKCKRPDYDGWWYQMMYNDAQSIVDKAICDAYDRLQNEKGLKTKSIDLEEFHRLLKIYTCYVKEETDNID